MKFPIWYIETDFGCGLRDYKTRSFNKAREEAIIENGTSYFQSIRRATYDDVKFVEMMGGHVPTAAKEMKP
jgi:hypothetical protein